MRSQKDIANLADEELAKQYRQTNNRQLVGVLYQRYTHLVYGLCLKYYKNKEESQDAVMQIFEQLLEKLSSHEVKHFKSWLYMVSKNHCLMQLRKKRQPEKDIEEVYHLADMPDDQQIQREVELQQMEEAIDQLKPEHKKCIELFYLRQKSYKEVVELTGYPLKRVKSYIQNGKRNLRIILTTQNEQQTIR